ncbi:MAG TPA: hypothetical protein VH539_15525 [Gemmatimonadaceae bacterium]|jgi:hypothetical protein
MQRIPVFSAAGESLGTIPANVVGIFGSPTDPTLEQLAGDIKDAGDLPRFRSSKYFVPRDFVGAFDAVVIDQSAPNADAVREYFAGKGVAVYVVQRDEHGAPTIPAEFEQLIAESAARTATRP